MALLLPLSPVAQVTLYTEHFPLSRFSIIPTSATLHLGFLPILHCICYPFFSSSFLFSLWFVIFTKLILCSIYAFHLGCELWALLISWLKTFLIILRIHGILSKSKVTVLSLQPLFCVPAFPLHVHVCTHTLFPSLAVALMQPGASSWSWFCWKLILKRKEFRLVQAVTEPQFACPNENL